MGNQEQFSNTEAAYQKQITPLFRKEHMSWEDPIFPEDVWKNVVTLTKERKESKDTRII